MNSHPKIAVLIMAAGGSSRMGKPKQLLPWQNATIIESIISTALKINSASVSVVLGAHHKVIKEKIKDFPIEIIYHRDWQRGLGTSIACGVKHIQAIDNFDAILILLGDQPFLTSEDLNSLVNKYTLGKKCIVASQYANQKVGVPVLFEKYFFKDLMELTDDKGAKHIIDKYIDHVITISFNNKLADIDTEIDYSNALKNNHQN